MQDRLHNFRLNFSFKKIPWVPYSIVLYAYKEEDKKPPKPTAAATAAVTAADKRLRFSNNLTGGKQDLLGDLTLTSERPLRNFDSTRLRLTSDTSFITVPTYTIKQDSTKKQIIIQTAWKEGTEYHLIIDSTFAEDTTGRKLSRSDTLDFSTRKTIDYGQLDIRIRNIDTSQNPVLQFVQTQSCFFAYSREFGKLVHRSF